MHAEDEGGALNEWRANWSLVLLTVVGITCSPAVLPTYGIAVLITPLQDAFGWGRGEIQTAILFSTGLGLVGAPLSGWMIERIGLRSTVLLGLVGIAGAVAACSLMTGALWQLYLLYALMALLGAGAGAVSWTFLIADRFDRARGLALGVALSGTGLAAIIMPWIAAAGLQAAGWRGSYLAIAGFALLVVVPFCALLLPRHRRHRRADSDAPATAAAPGEPSLTVAEVVRTPRFWLLGAATTFIYLAVSGIIPNLVPAMTDAGLTITQAVTVMSFLGGAIVVGRMAVGALVDHFWAPAVATCVLVPAAIACLVLHLPMSFAGYATAAVVIGIATGMEFDIVGFLVARYFGLADFARVYGRLYIFLAVGGGIAPFVFGAAFDVMGSYRVPFIIASGLLVMGALGLLAMGRYPARGEVLAAAV